MGSTEKLSIGDMGDLTFRKRRKLPVVPSLFYESDHNISLCTSLAEPPAPSILSPPPPLPPPPPPPLPPTPPPLPHVPLRPSENLTTTTVPLITTPAPPTHIVTAGISISDGTPINTQ